MLNLNNYFDLQERALQVHGRRSELLAANLANADTPHYKARDIDFRQALAAEQRPATKLTVSHAAHFEAQGVGGSEEVLYRNPLHASMDGNSVDAQMEKSEFTQNALQFMANLTFMSRKISGLMGAIKGE